MGSATTSDSGPIKFIATLSTRLTQDTTFQKKSLFLKKLLRKIAVRTCSDGDFKLYPCRGAAIQGSRLVSPVCELCEQDV